MTVFTFDQQLAFNSNAQGFNFYQFNYKSARANSTANILNDFLNSENFTSDCRPHVVKNNSEEKRYLGQLFIAKEISAIDFKKLSQSAILQYLVDFLNEPDWGSDRIEFSSVLNKYFEIEKRFNKSDFYLINKDWFNEDDQRVRQSELIYYSYYFLIVYIDKIGNILAMCEFAYD